jgi:hypothetical protein
MGESATLHFTIDRPDSRFFQRLIVAWAGLVLVAITYCLLHGYVAGTPYGSLEVPAKWAFGNWGVWPFLLPLCFLVVRRLAEHVNLLLAAVLVLPVAVVGASIFHHVFHSYFGDYGSFLRTLYYMTPIAASTYVLFSVMAFWMMGPVMLNPATKQAHLTGAATKTESLRAVKGRVQTNLGLDQVAFVQAARNYVELISGPDTYIMRASMKELETRLTDAGFVRIHRSYIVNRSAVIGLERGSNGEPLLRMAGGKTLPVGRAYRENIQLSFGFLTSTA